MIVFPNCKINLGLNILRKRSDGYHDIETIFFPVFLTDILEINEYREPEKTSFIPFNSSGIPIRGESSSNLCMKAYKMLKKDFPKLPHIQMHLHKVIPSGAGLGGGSSDAAFALKLLNKILNLNLTVQQLLAYADKLGSDCPFFIINKPCFATDRGIALDEIEISLAGYKILIVNPGIHVDTGRAFLNITPSLPGQSLKEKIKMPIEQWKKEIQNDFEKVIFKQHPEIGEIKDKLYQEGAIYASMSGSGSTVYGIFKKEKQFNISFSNHYFIRELNN